MTKESSAQNLENIARMVTAALAFVTVARPHALKAQALNNGRIAFINPDIEDFEERKRHIERDPVMLTMLSLLDCGLVSSGVSGIYDHSLGDWEEFGTNPCKAYVRFDGPGDVSVGKGSLTLNPDCLKMDRLDQASKTAISKALANNFKPHAEDSTLSRVFGERAAKLEQSVHELGTVMKDQPKGGQLMDQALVDAFRTKVTPILATIKEELTTSGLSDLYGEQEALKLVHEVTSFTL